ncbi:Orf38 [Heliothis zea nudivirus]|uniref:Orf38 n=1 Tax=Heliothis zea nudivirus 1 TaxID=3116536 RepID=Q8JKS3_9VIRU|nr:Orf38 [Heliothis zea nudivirus]AAN04333.1 Orf38 [Heliothis zea nudivirus]
MYKYLDISSNDVQWTVCVRLKSEWQKFVCNAIHTTTIILLHVGWCTHCKTPVLARFWSLNGVK